MTKHMLALPLVTALALSVAVPAARAADMPIKAPIYKSQPYYAPPSWTGFYLGVNAGYGWGKEDATVRSTSAAFDPTFAAGAVPGAVSLDPKGFIGGVQAGYNYQFGSWLLGAEADFQYSGIKDTSAVATPAMGLFVPSLTTVEHKMDWFGTARLRAGYVLMDALLFYATGGLAVGHVKDSASIEFASLAQLYSGQSTATKWGWTVGGGAEWAFSQKWTAKAEYLYYDLGTNTVDIAVVTGPAATAAADVPAKGHLGRLGLNYRF